MGTGARARLRMSAVGAQAQEAACISALYRPCICAAGGHPKGLCALGRWTRCLLFGLRRVRSGVSGARGLGVGVLVVVGALSACGRTAQEAGAHARPAGNVDRNDECVAAGRAHVRAVAGGLGGAAQWAAMHAACGSAGAPEIGRVLLEYWNSALTDALEHSDASVGLPRRHHGVDSREAQRVLRALRPDEEGARLVCLAALTDPEDGVRLEAASVLRDSRGTGSLSAGLFLGLHPHNVRLRATLLEVLAGGRAGVSETLAMRSALRDPEDRIRETALRAIGLHREWARALDVELRVVLGAPRTEREQVEAALALVAHCGPDSRDAWGILAKRVSRGDDVFARLYLLGRLRDIRPIPAEVLLALVRAVGSDECAWSGAHEDPARVYVACRATEALVGQGAIAVPVVSREHAVATGAALIRLEVLLMHLGVSVPERQSRLYEVILAGEVVAQRAALDALRPGDEVPQVLRLLVELALSGGWPVGPATEALARLGLPARDAIAAVLVSGSEHAALKMLVALSDAAPLVRALRSELQALGARATSEEVREQLSVLLLGK